MDKDTVKQAADAAWEEVLAHPAADLRRYLHSLGVELRGGAKPAARRCPLCEGKDTFAILPGEGGGWIYKCHKPACEAAKSGGIQQFIELRHGCDWKQARAILHQLTGIRNPWDDWQEQQQQETQSKAKAAKPKSAKPGAKARSKAKAAEAEADTEDEIDLSPRGSTRRGAEPEEAEEGGPEPIQEPDGEGEGEAPRFIRLPDIGRNACEAFWAALALSPGHRRSIRSKRGLDDPWIDAVGFKTACRGNKPLLEPLLALYPPNELLRCGLATRDPRDMSLRVADGLCGRIYNEETERWEDSELIIIPYIDGMGRIINLRPHKKSLSNRAFRDSSASELYEKEHNNLSMIYGEAFLNERPAIYEHSCVICEGEMKAAALRRTGIPAIAFPGIQFLRQNKQTGQAIKSLVDLLKRNSIREVVVVFDSEDKSNKPFHQRFEAEIYARYTALVLEDHAFKALFGMLPEEWREGGEQLPDGRWVNQKADWDGRLAHHVRAARSHASAVLAAGREFARFLQDRRGKQPRVRPVPRQSDWADIKEDIITQALNKLRHVPKIFIGGQHELALAAELTNWCHPKFADKLKISQLCAALRETYGGYYKPKPPSESLEKRALEALDEIGQIMEEHEGKGSLSDDELRQYRAARQAAYTALYRYPKSFTDFTATSEYKVLCYEPDGSSRLDRLVVFRDKNGVRSKPFQMAGDKLNSSQELRKFFPKSGGYHWWGNQEECDFWLQELDIQNYQRTITQIDTYGWNRDAGIYLLGDCAVTGCGKFIFPDKHGIIWHNRLGYKNAESAESGNAFCHKPPLLFPDEPNPKAACEAIDWEAEKAEVAKIWQVMVADMVHAFGSIAGYACIGGLLQYYAHPELLRHLSGKPGLWLQGRKGSGKTKTIEAGMRIFGFPRRYEIIALGSTKVGIERNMSQFGCFPIHIDEWRNNRADDNLVGLVTNAYNEIGISKGTSVGSKSTRKSRPATIPIITGEDGATDPALRSRYLRLIMAQSQRKGTSQEQKERYFQMLEHADSYYRVGRYLMRHREAFATMVVATTKEFMADPETSRRIGDDRAQEVTGVCLSALLAAHLLIDPRGELMPEAPAIRDWMLAQGADSCDDITGDVFMVNFFADCANMIQRGVPHADRYLRVCRGSVAASGKVNVLKSLDTDEGRVLVFVAFRELFDEYKADKGKLREQAPIARQNIQAELKAEDAWIPYRTAPKVHRYRLPWTNGGSDDIRTFWVLDYETCPPELREIFRGVYQRELAKEDLTLTDGEEVVHINQMDEFEPSFV